MPPATSCAAWTRSWWPWGMPRWRPRISIIAARSRPRMSLGAPRVDRHGCGTRRGAAAYRTGSEVEEPRMGIIWAIIIGFIAGVIAKFLMPGRDPGGFIITTVLGIVGSLVATWLGQAIGWYRPGEGAGLIGAVVGAIILLVIYRMIAGRRTV